MEWIRSLHPSQLISRMISPAPGRGLEATYPVTCGVILERISDKSVLQPGDTVTIEAEPALCCHVGIYVGNDEVIDFKNGLRKIPLADFIGSEQHVCRVQYAAPQEPDKPEDIVQRATQALQNPEGVGSYSIITNNSEHFVTYCALGKRLSFEGFKTEKVKEKVKEESTNSQLVGWVLAKWKSLHSMQSWGISPSAPGRGMEATDPVTCGVELETISDPIVLQPGDTVTVEAGSALCCHVGIYVGNDEVIDFENGLRKRPLADFIGTEQPLARVHYTAPQEPDKAEDIVQRATESLQNPEGVGSYNNITNNNEHFVTYCTFGKRLSFEHVKTEKVKDNANTKKEPADSCSHVV